MPSIFSRLKGKEGPTKIKSRKHGNLDQLKAQLPSKPRWEDAFIRKTVEPEEIHELVRRCTAELKARALDLPFLLLPFRPTSDPSAVRTFVRHFFDDGASLRGDMLAQELRMIEPMVISGVIKWCWARLQGGVVGWDAYELFKVGEQDSNMARDAFKTFIPLSVENEARTAIIFDFFDLLSAVAAHGKTNGFGGRKLSRMASWWAFEHKDSGCGFEGGYQAWLKAADATSHLFFAYLRSLAPQQTRAGISMLPMSLQKLLQETEYPPERPSLLMSTTNKVLMIVDTVSPTPFALLRRGNHFQYRDEDRALREFSEFEDPIQALTEECRRVLRSVSAANQTQAVSSSKHSTGLRDASWSRFEDIGFSSTLDEEDDEDDLGRSGAHGRHHAGLRTTPASGRGLGRPTTPSWADFLSAGFVDDSPNSPSNLLLPPDKVLPPIETAVRQRSSQSHRPRLESERQLEPGELASISRFELDDSFWWVWMTSLAPEETPERKSAFGRCAVIETSIRTGRWLVMEEQVKGAAPEPDAGAYIAEKKSFFSWTRRNKGIARHKSTKEHATGKHGGTDALGASKTSIAPDQQAKIHAAAQRLQARQLEEQRTSQRESANRRGRADAELMSEKTNSIMTLQPMIMSEASPAMKWANKYDKETIREAYLANSQAGRGLGQVTMQTNGHGSGHTPIYSPPSLLDDCDGHDGAPAPPAKPQPTVPTNNVGADEEKDAAAAQLSDKAVAAAREGHPTERVSSLDHGSTPLPPPPARPDEDDMMDEHAASRARRNMVSPEPYLSPESKSQPQQKKLHKEKDKASSGGFRKLFGRKNRQSKLPEHAAADLTAMMAHDNERAPAPPSKVVEPAVSRAESRADSYASPSEASETTPRARTPTMPGPAGAATAQPRYETQTDVASRLDTSDSQEARQEFSRFDQGPLADQPAFVPDDAGADDSETDDATPPPIARQRSPMTEAVPPRPTQEVNQGPPPMQDRWAQIRKNAAERAAQRQSEDKSQGGYSKTTDGDGDTSGEETIESRVARIKARVAELTGNMEGTAGPAGRAPPLMHR